MTAKGDELLDGEIETLRSMWFLMDGMTWDAKQRVIEYLQDRVAEDERKEMNK